MTLAVRLASPSLAQAASVRQQAQTILADVQTGPMTTISQELERSIARERLTSGIALFLAVLVVAIGCVGIYALMTYDVARRQREFGVRLALGATVGRLVATVLRDGATIVVPALAIGLPAGACHQPPAGGAALRCRCARSMDALSLSRSCYPSWQWARRSDLRGSPRASIRWRCCATSKLRIWLLLLRQQLVVSRSV